MTTNNGRNLVNSDMYERKEGGQFQKKERFSINKERRLVVEACHTLESRGIEYKVEYNTHEGRRADIYIPEVNLAIEAKRKDYSDYVRKGIEQCISYRESGHNFALLVPFRHPDRDGNPTEIKLRDLDIPFIEYNPEESGFNIIHSCGEMAPLILA